VQANWDKIGVRMAAHQQALLETKTTIKEQVSNLDARSGALAEVDRQLGEISLQRDVLGVTVGLNQTLAGQMALLERYGQTYTDDYSYDPRDQVAKRYKAPLEAYRFTQRGVVAPNGITVRTPEASFGGGKQELNRVSFTTALDAIMCEAIGKYDNVDGYSASDMPSLFHRNASLEAEMALFAPRSSVVLRSYY